MTALTSAESGKRLDKLRAHDEWAAKAITTLEEWLLHEPELLAAIAKGRHAEGSLRFGDRLMYEHSQDTLLAEAAQELADAINYVALWLQRDAA